MKIFPLHFPLGIDEQNLLQKNKEQQTVPHIAIRFKKLFIFVIISFFRFRYTFYHVNDYSIKLCGILRCDDRTSSIILDILSNLSSI